MGSRKDFFSISGPPPIPSVDWNNLYHRTSLISCLVKGVSILERDRKKKRSKSDSPARDWWASFNFTLLQPLIDASDGSIYGAVFENVNNHQNTTNSIVPPRYVIALRGTMGFAAFHDWKLNLRIPFEIFHRADRSVVAIQEIKSFVDEHGNTNVWIAGYSLGAAIALLVGKTLARSGFPIEAYIFNPPISLIPVEQSVTNDYLKYGFRFSRDFFKATVALALDKGQEDRQLMNLASWKPYLFVNQSDVICSEYIGYFKHGVLMTKLGLGKIAKLASGYSVRRMMFGGGENLPSDSSSQHLHFLPSAHMMVNKTEPSDLRACHKLRQWWDPKLPQTTTCDSYMNELSIY